MSTYIYCLKNCFDYRGKATRSEYWYFMVGRMLLFSVFLLLYSYNIFNSLQYGRYGNTTPGTVVVVTIIGAAILGIWDFLAGLAVTVRRLNDIQWPIYCLAALVVPYANLVLLIACGCVKGKLSNDDKIFVLNRLLNELHQEFMKQGPQSGLVFIPCPEYGQEVAELAALKISDSGKYQASYSGGCFAIKAIKKAA